ncbi:hypothetical protein A8708_21465 [Paenibacillus oryzisoli]|uniref:Uncharacterized protein n=1 Tax=Paenibacillus oryzisoli TaxID=1850517 RepID=A0A198A8E6_9BACL|nr:hypothetical protein A8708_21465 [Paenibacillus oryzisoli]
MPFARIRPQATLLTMECGFFLLPKLVGSTRDIKRSLLDYDTIEGRDARLHRSMHSLDRGGERYAGI